MVKLLYDEGETREKIALCKYLFLNSRIFLSQLGITGPFWCGLFLDRQDIWGRDEGDVDLIAGKLEFNIPKDKWRSLITEAKNRHPKYTNFPPMLKSQAKALALQRGHILWRPSTEYLVGCEAKASWYDPCAIENRRLKCSHENESSKIKWQLEKLLDHGVDKVSYLHLLSTKPDEKSIANEWTEAFYHGVEAEEELTKKYIPMKLAECGYYYTTMAAVPHKEEHYAGAGGNLRVMQHAKLNSRIFRDGVSDWRTNLAFRLSQIKNYWPETFIISPKGYNKWLEFPTTEMAMPFLRGLK